jgi:hypothetical protein
MTTTYELATDQDDAELRALLRDNAMPSWVTMTVSREPSFFAGANRFGRDWAVIARQDASPVGMYACSEQSVHLNGAPCELGYLGALRLNPSHRNRLRILRDGFASVRTFSPPRSRQLWYTAIASENLVARRILEANIRSMPRYRAINELVTLALPRARGRRRSMWRQVQPGEMGRLCSFYNQHACQYQFSPALTVELAVATGASFFVVAEQGEFHACMALWNQQNYKQVVACAYRRPLGTLLPVYNAYARLTSKIPLPRVGQALDLTHLAFLAVAPPLDQEIVALIEDALAINPTAVLTLGLHTSHPWLASLVRTYRPTSYRTWIYAVNFDDSVSLDGRPAQPEVAVL